MNNRVSGGVAEHAEKTNTSVLQFSAFSAPPREIHRMGPSVTPPTPDVPRS
ncbi:hypothetical protein J421_6219 (plasmid) [Gemmatirosa kalamazoonensis]|uniref:Uncharacterized protein n=1 Tax=Gemmatirosa kalamazoonensis TaxID=861299 RepID=W0RS10_9BACT|nr:hypothetical protein J421_6219 [Gemmatirosa kalamazoonensis]